MVGEVWEKVKCWCWIWYLRWYELISIMCGQPVSWWHSETTPECDNYDRSPSPGSTSSPRHHLIIHWNVNHLRIQIWRLSRGLTGGYIFILVISYISIIFWLGIYWQSSASAHTTVRNDEGLQSKFRLRILYVTDSCVQLVY